MQLNHYETVFVLTPVLSKTQRKEVLTKFTNLLIKEKAQVIQSTSWDLKELAYPIKKHKSGLYEIIEFKAPATAIPKLEIAYKRDESVIRFLTTKLDKHGVAYNEQKRIEETKKLAKTDKEKTDKEKINKEKVA